MAHKTLVEGGQMKLVPSLIMGFTAGIMLSVSACSSSDPAGASTFGSASDQRILLLSDEKRDGESGPEALFEGKLTVTSEGCVVGEGPDGEIWNLQFPAGTVVNPDDPNVVVMEFAELTIGESYAFGGSAGSNLSDDNDPNRRLPETCLQTSTFAIYTVS